MKSRTSLITHIIYDMKTDVAFYYLKMKIASIQEYCYYTYSEIVSVKYERPYCEFCCMNDGTVKKFLVNLSLTEIKGKLPEIFFACNRQVIINMCYLRRYDRINNVLELTDGTVQGLSRRRIHAFEVKESQTARISPLCPPCYACTKHCEGRSNFSNENNLPCSDE